MISNSGTSTLGLYDFKRQVDAFGGVDDNTVESVAEMLAIQNPHQGMIVHALAYRSGSMATNKPFLGGGDFYYDESKVGINNGGTIFNGWVRIYDSINIDDFGAHGDAVTDDSIEFQNALNFCTNNSLELNFSDACYVIENEATVDGAETLFRSVRLRGTFSSTGVSAQYGWWTGRGGTTIVTKGNSLLTVWFRRFFNENIVINNISIVNDSASFPSTLAPHAIRLIKGDPIGYPDDKRYITGNIFNNFATSGFVAGVLFRGNYKKTDASSYLSNYIGNTTFDHFYPYQCGSGIVVENATLNRLRVSNSMFFSNSLGAIIKREAVDLIPTERTEMLVMCQLDMVHFEDCRGMFRFFGQNPTNEFKNYIVMNDVTREFCGMYDGINGSPYGIVEYTNIFVNGRHDQYGETSLPVLGVGSTLTAQVEMSANLITQGAKTLSPEKINLTKFTGNLVSGGLNLTKGLVLAEGVGHSFDVTTDVIVDDGSAGCKTFRSVGKTQSGTGGRIHIEAGSYVAGVSVTVNTAAGGNMQEFIVSNTTGATVKVDIVVRRNNTGVQCYLV